MKRSPELEAGLSVPLWRAGLRTSRFDKLKPFDKPIDWLRVVSEVEPLRP